MSALLEPTVRVISECPFTRCDAVISMVDVPAGWTSFECGDGHTWRAPIADPDVCDRPVGGGLWCGLEPGHDDGCAAVIS